MKPIVILLLVLVSGCGTPEGHIGVSLDITEAKQRGVFIAEYKVSNNPYKINDSLQLTVKQSWLEQHWGYGANNQTLPMAGYQLCINTTKKDENKIEEADGYFGVDYNHYLRESGDDSFMGDFNDVPIDTIEYLLQHGDNLMDDSSHKKEIFGKIILLKK